MSTTIPITVCHVRYSRNYEDAPKVRKLVTVTDEKGKEWKSWSAKLFMAIPIGTRMIVELGKRNGYIKIPKVKRYNTRSWSASDEAVEMCKAIADAEYNGNQSLVINKAIMELARMRGYNDVG